MSATDTATDRDTYEVIDPAFRWLIQRNARLDRLATGFRWAEGPVWITAYGVLLFSDIPNQRMMRMTAEGQISVFRQPSNFSNGNTLDREGRLVTCEHGTRRVTRTEHDGRITVLADSHQGKRLNSPNDVVVKSDGSVWFTDPSYGILGNYEGYKAPVEQDAHGVYRIGTDGKVSRVTDAFVQPNGLAFSPDESVLYVADSGSSHDPSVPPVIRALPVEGEGLGAPTDFCEVDAGLPDGFRVDIHGNVWSSAKDGVQVFDPKGNRIGRIRVPETVSNLTFGGPARNRLYITATTSVYTVYTETQAAGAPVPTAEMWQGTRQG